MNITDFLAARIAEDEAEARKYQRYEDQILETAGWFDPSRVLAECASKRALLTLFRTGAKFEVSAGGETGWISPLTILAIPYRGHPDYDPEWGA